MKEFIQDSISSILRFFLVAYGGWLATTSGVEISTDPEALTLFELIFGAILALLGFALKKVDGLGSKGALVGALVGPRVNHMAHSVSRWLVGLLAGVFGAITATQGTSSELGLGDTSITSFVVLLAGFAYDRVSKMLKP